MGLYFKNTDIRKGQCVKENIAGLSNFKHTLWKVVVTGQVVYTNGA